ncbi:hypothetical protein ACFQNE_05025 [Gordonia phosphorivorans]|uniref:LppI n=1 Tax=Gordonia phosphorivorans TaxID=1056982 RepID=A0ABV6H795_9ACTN
MATVQGYGSTERPPTTGRFARRPGRLAATLLAVAAVAATSACGLLDERQNPKAIEIPATNALITESSTAVAASTSSAARAPRSFVADAPDSVAAAIAATPRVGVSDFHIGATTDTGERLDDLSGVHFSTPDRGLRCSTGNNGAGALVCAGDRIDGPSTPPPNSPEGCEWNKNLAVLNSEGATAGGCANLYPVLYRSHILEFGSTLVAGSFRCLSEVEGLYCLESGTETGFSITADGYERIHADDRAPAVLLGESAANSPRATAPSPTR